MLSQINVDNGLGSALLQKAIDKYGDKNLIGQFSSEQSVKNAYKLGFRNPENNDLKWTLNQQREHSSVYMEYKKKKKGDK